MSDMARKWLAWLEIITGAGIILFWLGFFTVGLAPDNPPPGYMAYEHSFPLPDSLLCILLIIAGIFMLKKARAGLVLSLIAAGGLMFLGVVDFSFNIQNGVYASSPLDLALNAFINAWCVGFGLALAIVCARSS